MRLLFVFLALLTPVAASAITILPPCTDTGDCGITDILAVFLNVAEWLLAISGAVAFAVFIYGGFLYILGGANEENVKKAKDVLRNAVIGLAIIFFSGAIIRFTTSALTGNEGNVCLASNNAPKPADRTYKTPKGVSCVPAIGDACKDGGGSFWISIPAGYTDANDPSGTFVAESLECIIRDDCKSLNSTLSDRKRADIAGYKCMNVDDPKASNCVRGLCSGGANQACCHTQ